MTTSSFGKLVWKASFEKLVEKLVLAKLVLESRNS